MAAGEMRAIYPIYFESEGKGALERRDFLASYFIASKEGSAIPFIFAALDPSRPKGGESPG